MSLIPSKKDLFPHSSSHEQWHWIWAAALIIITLITLAFRYALPIRDSDIWFHMLYGKYFLEHKTLIADHTIFSWTPSTNETIYCTWLPDIFFYLLHQTVGLTGLFVFRYFCMSLLVVACFFFSRKHKVASHPLVWILCLIALLMSYTAAYVKPEILSFSFMILVAWNWWHIRSGGVKYWRHCYLFPIIMLIWVNTHGGFIFGAIFFILIGLGELLNTWLSPHNVLSSKVRKHLGISLFAAAVTPFLTPYGYHYPYQLFWDLMPTAANMSYNSKVASYIAPFTQLITFHDFPLFANLAIIILVLLYFNNFKKIEWSSLLTNLTFAFLYTKFYRTTFYWAPIFMLSSINLLTCPSTYSLDSKLKKIIYKVTPIGTLVLALFLAGNTYIKSSSRPETYLWMGFGISEGNPVEEAHYIKKYFPKSRIGNLYDQGAYLLWLLWPENHVFFDARHFPYKKWSDEFFNFFKGKNVREMTEKYPCDLWVISLTQSRLLFTFIQDEEWQLAYYGKNSAVLLRSDIEIPANAPSVSPQISNSKNLANAINTFAFSCNIKDWQTAEEILLGMKQNFKWPYQQDKIEKVTYYLAGTQAYYERNYQQAIDNIIKSHPDIIDSTLALTNSYIALSASAWSRGDSAKALSLNQKAWDLSPGNLYSAYNAGIIGWVFWKTLSPKDRQIASATPLGWQSYLEYFINMASGNTQYQKELDMASQILGNIFSGDMPSLVLPPSMRVDQSATSLPLPPDS